MTVWQTLRMKNYPPTGEEQLKEFCSYLYDRILTVLFQQLQNRRVPNRSQSLPYKDTEWRTQADTHITLTSSSHAAQLLICCKLLRSKYMLNYNLMLHPHTYWNHLPLLTNVVHTLMCTFIMCINLWKATVHSHSLVPTFFVSIMCACSPASCLTMGSCCVSLRTAVKVCMARVSCICPRQ